MSSGPVPTQPLREHSTTYETDIWVAAARCRTQTLIMPIAPEHRWFYPIDWRELSYVIRFTRAQGRCEHCGRPHGQDVTHLGDGTWWDPERGTWRDGHGRRVRKLPPPHVLEEGQPNLTGIPPAPRLPVTHVVLASAHLDHDPSNNRSRNLAALCQRCHMLHDSQEHRRRRWSKVFRLRALGDLFE
jgi:hypothetical protein